MAIKILYIASVVRLFRWDVNVDNSDDVIVGGAAATSGCHGGVRRLSITDRRSVSAASDGQLVARAVPPV